MNRSLFAAFALSLSVVACSRPYESVDFDLKSSPPVPVRLDSDMLSLVAGVAIQVKATPLRKRRGYAQDVRFSLRAQDPDKLAVYPGQGHHEFVLVGLAPGDTCLDVLIERDEKECIPVTIANEP